MPKALSLSLTISDKLYLFRDTEPDDDSYVIVKKASQAVVERVSELNSMAEREAGTDKVRTFFNAAETIALEVYETMVECNLVTEPGGPLIFKTTGEGTTRRLDMSEGEFRKKWSTLPPEWCDKIYEAVLTQNPNWDPKARARLKEQ